MNTLKLLVIALLALVVVAGSSALVSELPEAIAEDQDSASYRFDKCKIECNEIYGGVDVFPPPATGGRYLGWANCVLECERKFWKRFDKEMESGD